ncbi:MAG: hypothetical protein DRG24_03760 [Epsilonproteobacteria bacterium]|nr:MAG: hypothetical protein DRG24_03760 [Campylobacterota bacterium]
MKFVETLIKSIVDNKDMPKVQVEREISPILEIFIESFMNNLAINNKVEEGTYKFIAPEFPLSNEDENNRSVNIDYLLLNEKSNTLYFIELKTDSSSFKLSQYEYYKNTIHNKTTTELYNFLKDLENKKYKNYKIKVVDESISEEEFKKIKHIKLIYLAPKKLTLENTRRSGAGQDAINSIEFITFEDLHMFNDIDHEFSAEWNVITSHLVKLDKN